MASGPTDIHAAIEDLVDTAPAGELELKGFHHPVPAFAVTAARGAVA